MEVKSFTDLTCWKEARVLKVKMYKLAKSLPDFEQYKLASQIRSSAVSITANIAEGYGRYTFQEKMRFAHISRGSQLEVMDHLITCFDVGYLSESEFKVLCSECDEVGKSINGYIGFLKSQKFRYTHE